MVSFPLKTIWERYIFKNLFQSVLFFLFCFFLVYSLVDFATHAQDFSSAGKMQPTRLFVYYMYQFVKRLPLLLPLALLIGTIKVLSALNASRELLALQVCGLQRRKIFRPFFLLALLCTLTSYANEEFFLPKLTSLLEETKQTTALNSLPKLKKKQFVTLYLTDSSKLIYQRFDKENNLFFDVYWIRSFNDIWRMKTLSANPETPICQYADHILRNADGFLEKVESYDLCKLPFLKWDTSLLNKKQSSIKYQKLSTLAVSMIKEDNTSFHVKGEIKTYFFYKLIMPLLPFLILFGSIPFCVSYSRNPPIFLVYGLSIFGFVIFFTLMNAMVIIGENQVIPPYAAIFSPFLICLGALYPKFRQLI